MGSKFSVARMRKELAAQTMTTITTSGDSTVGSGFVLSDVGSLTVSGTTVADAAAIANHVTLFTGSAGAGMYLPLGATTGEVYVLAANTSNGVKLYATGSETINGVAGSTALVLTGSAICIKGSSTAWGVIKNA